MPNLFSGTIYIYFALNSVFVDAFIALICSYNLLYLENNYIDATLSLPCKFVLSLFQSYLGTVILPL